MRADHLNLRHLRAFAAVCEHRGISRAAQDIHLSQPALTQAMSKLERNFGTRLFERGNKGMFPTAAGEILGGRVRRAFDLLANVSNRRDRMRGGLSQVVTSTQLRALIAVAKHGNFSVAARAEQVSQPSLHRAARDLEALTGVPLFTKSAQGIALTLPAKALLLNACLAFSELDHAIEEIGETRGAEAGALRVGSLPLSLGTILPRALNNVTGQRPNLRATVMDAPFAELLFALRHGEIDLILGALRNPAPAPDVVQDRLFDDRLCIVCRPGHPLLPAASPDRAELARHPWVVARPNTPTRRHFDKFFKDFPLSEHGPLIASNSMILVRQLLQGSDRLSMISRTQAEEHLRAGTLALLPIDLGDTPREIGVTYRAAWQPTPAQADFLRSLRKVAEDTGRAAAP